MQILIYYNKTDSFIILTILLIKIKIKTNMNKFKKMFRIASIVLLAMVTMTACKDDDDTVIPPDVVLDGLYITGGATSMSALASNGMMKKTRNEVTQTERATLYELYIPLKAGATGFNIVKVAGSVQTIYGPVTASWGEISQGTTDEPKVPFQRGLVAANANKFTVPTDGMYHVAIDMELMKAVIVPVHWGVIGAATPNGWGASLDLTESAFNLTTMTWSKSNVELRGGDWKFRYSNGWKVELDTVLDLGGGQKGVKINTNFGGTAITTLVPGGANFVNAAPGVYTIALAYTLGTGYVATLTKTGDLPLTNWTGVQCDAVGTGVSIDNAASIVDPSTWNWGRVMLADNGAVPTKVGDKYTWTWTNIVLEANEGFKLRTKNGVAPPVGGANFDVGFSAVTASSPKVIDLGGNLGVNAKGTFTIKLEIDAANSDAKKIIITE
jgi:hypothetical protein